MKKLFLTACALAILSAQAMAQDCCDPDYYARNRETNALRDSARAQERQADSLRNIERYERDRNIREDRASRNRH